MSALIEPMKKIQVKLLGEEKVKAVSAPQAATFSFIYGVGRQGVTGFEKRLAGKKVGDILEFEIRSGEAHTFFGSLAGYFCSTAGSDSGNKQTLVQLEVVGVSNPEHREVVKALAASLTNGGGCGGSCGCGC